MDDDEEDDDEDGDDGDDYAMHAIDLSLPWCGEDGEWTSYSTLARHPQAKVKKHGCS